MQRLGRYERGPILGKGGAGRVYEAVLHGPRGFTKPVALKVLHHGHESLRREARIGGLLRHRNLVDVYEISDDGGQWFCAMELCSGGALSKHVPLPPRAVVEVGLQVCAALQYAHEDLGLVHLDIKPQNLLLADGVVKVADLGISHAEGFEEGRRAGTPGYMPMEQAHGAELDARADIYALGVTLVGLATVSRPSRPGTVDPCTVDSAALARLAGQDADEGYVPTGPGSEPEAAPLPPGVPAWLAPAVSRCLAQWPDDRWPDMASLAEALRGLTVDGPGLREAVGWVPAPAPVRPDTNLGLEPDAFVGRQAELAMLTEALTSPCLLTLKGPAGIGKSRLASTAARRWHRRTGRPAWFCDLSDARGLEGLVGAVARTLDV
ncbi:MAG: serine/threonine-protein kinase PknK, partial [Actinomycetia bacterium]|nr:serine/threonine-protein kinase PknK [Actinomycetes bacterium]